MAKAKATAAANVDDILEGKADDVLEGKSEAKAKKASKKAAPAKEAAKPAKGKPAKEPAKPAKAEKPAKAKEPKPKAKAESAGDRSAATNAVRAILAKVRKLTAYSDIATANDLNIRLVRRTARAMRDAGELELVREGTAVFVRAVAAKK